MRHKKRGRRLSRDTSHRQAMIKNMLVSLFKHERIETTVPRAKELRPVAEKVITLGKRGDLHARRQALSILNGDKEVVHKLFTDLAERNKDRQGGYTRILKTRFRYGDCAPMSFIELVERDATSAAE
ncbi:LSU ribosomal protein L17P [Magnetococcus marinus MC-1]|uniref:Large ribosomal subunit protein bL17 n=1 Tax=Magnetococcus marinus (strain ATCC BAA-1437 / JCM 17883 / MC-1) TaxID=156889 RepID=RL17_MAGMM|nr:50S ribosomal protein L17 [Magnetococcus marinus]A0L5Z9.1 RecName: Full=Large ribosomal subunit protein bL17; AltName: Full=50S ribosomal protein L17 [Magnetococcus marinus MC-1]ABK43392.1 LSU ribosomal protein L17P [Magnetococcus marinus MC-1]